ncbi:hypothetical protein [Enterococcus faecium]|uniref:hypothetical protein n=1 Tax=Enterococcus faecium TaxID=1352 RepID=UPI0029530560|nr:hypothetical protein [Enterococcus faecium]MDV7729902.1 hypothetical protein [Enterococcus faecium]
MIFGYARVSSLAQNLDTQIEKLKAANAKRKSVFTIFLNTGNHLFQCSFNYTIYNSQSFACNALYTIQLRLINIMSTK